MFKAILANKRMNLRDITVCQRLLKNFKPLKEFLKNIYGFSKVKASQIYFKQKKAKKKTISDAGD